MIVFHLSQWHSLKLSFFSNITLIKCATNIKVREVDFQEFFLVENHLIYATTTFFYGEILSIKLHNMKHILLYEIVVLSIVLILAIPSTSISFCVKIFTQKLNSKNNIDQSSHDFFCVIFEIFAQLFWIKKIEEGTRLQLKGNSNFWWIKFSSWLLLTDIDQNLWNLLALYCEIPWNQLFTSIMSLSWSIFFDRKTKEKIPQSLAFF